MIRYRLFFPDRPWMIVRPRCIKLTSCKSIGVDPPIEELCLKIEVTPWFHIFGATFLILLVLLSSYWLATFSLLMSGIWWKFMKSNGGGVAELYCDARVEENIKSFYADENWQNLGKRWFNNLGEKIFFEKYSKVCIWEGEM